MSIAIANILRFDIKMKQPNLMHSRQAILKIILNLPWVLIDILTILHTKFNTILIHNNVESTILLNCWSSSNRRCYFENGILSQYQLEFMPLKLFTLSAFYNDLFIVDEGFEYFTVISLSGCFYLVHWALCWDDVYWNGNAIAFVVEMDE